MSSINWIDGLGLFLYIAGFVIGLGAVTVIDIHGFLGRRSPYWTEATIRTHKVTKPMIWVGIILVVVGALMTYRNNLLETTAVIQFVVAAALIINGCFLSFWLSPRLLAREREGRSAELLPASWQGAIAASLIVSDVGWWLSVILLVRYILLRGF